MVGYNHTLSVRQGDEVIARCCSFQCDPTKEGTSWTIYKGKIVQRQYQNIDAVVKVSANLDKNRASREVQAQVRKFDFAATLLQESPSAADSVILVPTFHSSIDKVGKCSKLRGKLCSKRQRGNACKDAPVLIQDFVSGEIKELFRIGENCRVPSIPEEGAPLLELVHESYRRSKGDCVIAGLKGVVVRDAKNGRLTYHVTSLTMHSKTKEYGETDRGADGIELYEAWSGLSRRAQPSAPPLTPCENSFGHGLPQDLASSFFQTMSPPPVPQFSASQFFLASQLNSVTSEKSKGSEVDSTQFVAQLLDQHPELRHLLSEMRLNELWGRPPSYSLVEGA